MTDEDCLQKIAEAERDLKRRVNGKRGPIIIESHSGEDFDLHSRDERVFIGAFLNGGEVTEDTKKQENRLILPTEGYIQIGMSFNLIPDPKDIVKELKRRKEETLRLVRGSVNIPRYELRHWNNGVHSFTGQACFGDTRSIVNPNFYIAVGEDEVQLATSSGCANLLAYLASGREDLQELARYLQRQRRNFDRRIFQMYELLEQPMPENLREAGRIDYLQRRNSILGELESALLEGVQLQAKVEKVDEGASPDKEVRTEAWYQTTPFIPHKYDIDDALLFNWSKRDRLARLKGSITRSLEEAMNLGLHQREERVEMGMPGRYIQLPTYITSLCQRFGVELSEQGA